jgi:response regulator NasT
MAPTNRHDGGDRGVPALDVVLPLTGGRRDSSPARQFDQSPFAVNAMHPERLPDQPKRLLVADDDPLLVEDLVARVTSLGFEVVASAPDGSVAVHEARQHMPDLALLDMRMPGIDGAAAARAMFTELAIPAVMISAHAENEDLGKAKRAGVFGYLVKPVTTKQVRAGVDVAWERFLHHVQTNWQVASLRTRLAQRKTIERAKWALVEGKGLTEPAALRTLQDTARERRAPLIHIAREVLHAIDS